ncbi:MAG: NAD(P)(+) transhydrogenase (Re/Si-specific) subunit beta [Desulfovibrio sp.]|nr:NAD(P)(+) transhydrogenase (Re/Si-specific) subunit beta [Desulfovibrio sp.]
MSSFAYYIIATVLAVAILYGLHLMSNVKTAVRGNAIAALAMALAILITMLRDNSFGSVTLWVAIAAGMAFGLFLSNKVKMIQMPQLVAFLHGFGGGAAALVGLIMLVDVGPESAFHRIDACLALCSGMTTIAGSFVAAGKLHQVLPQRPIVLPNHSRIVNILLGVMGVALVIYNIAPDFLPWVMIGIMFVTGALFGVVFTLRVGGADMPITISLLNSMGGISCAIAGFAVADPLLIAVGGIIGSAGYMLTRVMCKAMNRRLMPILLGESSVAGKKPGAAPAASAPAAPKAPAGPSGAAAAAPAADAAANDDAEIAKLLRGAKRVIIVPGYGMALAQAQHQVKQLADALEANGAKVDYAIHPVAGRMPGHMNVLLAEANVDYEHLLEMDTVNPLFPEADLVVIVGANDVVNPAANTAEGTPIYGMPILDVDKAKGVIVCNYDEKPGYAGVPNPLYKKEGVHMRLGDAAKTVAHLVDLAKGEVPAAAPAAGASATSGPSDEARAADMLKNAKRVIIVPGYGMALAQAQHKVKQLADALEANGAKVDYAIHPVAGRMPGHMNVLLAEANVDYEHLLEMDTVNPLFPEADLVVIVGANDVVNPAANTAEGTPIYGMPILDVDKARGVIVCNYDGKPGYAGVENPLYSKPGAILMFGDAAKTVGRLVDLAQGATPEGGAAPQAADAATAPAAAAGAGDAAAMLKNAKRVIIVPGYGMALAQAQHKVKQLADALEANGAKVDYAIHPVAGRMPGHMNVLLAEANVDYEHLLEMDTVNPLFPEADLVVIVGANDVVNPAANTAEGTPIYGMPILDVDKAKGVIICNYDEKPGYAGVENPLYSKPGVVMMLGDAAASLDRLLAMLRG